MMTTTMLPDATKPVPTVPRTQHDSTSYLDRHHVKANSLVSTNHTF